MEVIRVCSIVGRIFCITVVDFHNPLFESVSLIHLGRFWSLNTRCLKSIGLNSDIAWKQQALKSSLFYVTIRRLLFLIELSVFSEETEFMFPAGPVTWYWAKRSQVQEIIFLFSVLVFQAGHTWFGLTCIIAASCTIHLWLRYCFCFQGYSVFHQKKRFLCLQNKLQS